MSNPHVTQPLEFIHATSYLERIQYHRIGSSQLRKLDSFLKLSVQYMNIPIVFDVDKQERDAMAKFRESTFAALTLTASDEKKFDEWVKAENVDAMTMLNRLGGDGFKFSASYVFDQNAWCFSIIGTDNTKEHASMVMTSWSDDLGEAIAIGAYKHYTLCNGGEWPTRDNAPRWG